MKANPPIKKVVALVLAQFIVPRLSAQVQRSEQIQVLTLLGRPLPVVVGEMRGTRAKFALVSSDLMRAALAAGKGDLAYAAVDNAGAMGEISGIDVLIESGDEVRRTNSSRRRRSNRSGNWAHPQRF